jgi:hypothetical protein
MKGIILIFLIYAIRGETFCLPPATNVKFEHKLINASILKHSIDEFNEVAEKLLSKDEHLTITFEALNSGVNAEIIKTAEGPVIRVLGGMLQHPEMNSSAFSLLLCHELGHYLGGPPLKSRNGWSSTEGQADYFSGERCALYLRLTDDQVIDGALRLTKIYSEVTGEVPPVLDSCDETRVSRINYGYPKLQCRLDTILAGWRNEKRPACWFYE